MIRTLLTSISLYERKMLVILTLALLVATTLPYGVGYFLTPEGSTYTGIHGLTSGDFNVYYSFIEQVKLGRWGFENLFTSEPTELRTINPFWLAVGWFAKFFHLPAWAAMQGVRLLLIPPFILTAYGVFRYFFNDSKTRMLAMVFLLFASGVGGLLAPFFPLNQYRYNWPMDLWVPEAVTFLTLLHSPHFILSSTLFLFVFWMLLLSSETNQRRYSLAGGVGLLFWMSFHPFHLPTILVIPMTYCFVVFLQERKFPVRFLKHLGIMLWISTPSILYQFILMGIDPAVGAKAELHTFLTPKPWFVLVSYGFLGLLAIGGAFRMLENNKEKKGWFLAVWFIVQGLLLYAPLGFPRRLSQNFHFPIAGLAAVVGDRFVRRIPFLILAIVFVVFFAFSNLYVVMNDVLLYAKRPPLDYFYLSSDVASALEWLKTSTQESDVILANAFYGNFIPGWSVRRVYVGHGIETIRYREKLEAMQWFFGGNGEDEKKEKFLFNERIHYVFFSSRERQPGGFRPEEKSYLASVFQNSTVTIFETKNARGVLLLQERLFLQRLRSSYFSELQKAYRPYRDRSVQSSA